MYICSMEKVYFIKHKGIDAVKIGRTVDLGKRLLALNNASPYGIEVIGVIESEDSLKLEMSLHKRFSSFRLNGEWFSVSEDVILNIIRLYKDDEYIKSKNMFEIHYNKKTNYSDDYSDIDILKNSISSEYNHNLGFIDKVILNQKEIIEKFSINDKKSIKIFMESNNIEYKTHSNDGYLKKGYKIYLKK